MTTAMNDLDKVAPVRHMNFEFDASKASKYVWNDNSWGSAFILTFSAFIPAGEKMVIEAVRNFRDHIDDPVLKAEVNSLIGQEAAHSRIHDEFNQMYDLKGLPIGELARLSERIYMDYLVNNLPRKTVLAMACAVEHVTALLAEKNFSEGIDLYDEYDEPAADFLNWHLLEELEHKSIAYDLYEAVDGRYLHRVVAFVLVWGLSVPLGLYSVDRILKTPGFNQGKKANRAGIRNFGTLFLGTVPKLLAYFRPGFHPNDIDTTDMLLEWREKFFGEQGRLSSKVTKTILPRRKTKNKKRKAAMAN
ncbi:MAG: metal-dependent hydrolase [Ketobacteraceae bacterium]|nr:metal-dependent hydrolase [Ketobacteraceae bacterium]